MGRKIETSTIGLEVQPVSETNLKVEAHKKKGYDWLKVLRPLV